MAGRTANSGRPGARGESAAVTTTLALRIDAGIAQVMLNRPDVRNAFNATLIAELRAVLSRLDADPQVRVVVLSGAGASFCAGADLNWMQQMAAFSARQNRADAGELAAMLAVLDRLSKPTVARVHGAAFGGGAGLVACCDIAVGTPDATFAFSEARLGLIPAAISPYVVAAIGARGAPLFPDRRAVFRRRGAAPGPAARARPGAGARLPDRAVRHARWHYGRSPM